MKEEFLKEELLEIAKRNSYEVEIRGDLEPRLNDWDDFVDVSVCGLESMLREAYELGKKDRGNDNE